MNATSVEKIKNNDGEGKFFNFRPCLFTALFLCLGIVFSNFAFGYGVSLWWAAVVLVLPIVFYFLLRKKLALFAGCALALAFLIGVFSYGLKASDFTDTKFYNSYDSKVYGRIVKMTDNGETTLLVLDEVNIDGNAEKGKLVAYLPTTSCENIRLSDLVFVYGRVLTKTELYGKNATYKEYFADDVRFYANGRGISVSGHTFDLFSAVRELLKERLYTGMNADAAPVSFAILTGDTSGIDDGLLDNVRRGGVAHIFAVSGLHIGTLYGVGLFLFSKIEKINNRKALKFSLMSALLLLYGGVCGYSESVLRAVITCLVAYSSNLIGVKKDSLESLSLAVLILLLINPVSLFCIGFQLSFAACYGIALLSKPLQTAFERGYRYVAKRTEEYPVSYTRGTRGGIFSFLSVTVSAQVATAPILLNAFGFLSVWGLLLNGIFVPCVGVLFSLTMGFSALACLLPSALCEILLFLPNLIWTIFLLAFEIGVFSVAFENVTIGFLGFVCYATALVVLSDKLNLKKQEKIFFSALLFISFLVAVFL